MTPLIYAPMGEELIIVRISAEESTAQHLRKLGFKPGTAVRVLSCNGGNIIVSVGEGRVALSRESASRIFF